MDTAIISNLIENSPLLGILAFIIWFSMTKLDKSVNRYIKNNTAEHRLLVMLYGDLKDSIAKHELSMYGLNALDCKTEDCKDKKMNMALQSFSDCVESIKKLQNEIHTILEKEKK